MDSFEKFEKHFKKKNIATARTVDFSVMKDDKCDIEEPFVALRW